MSEEMKELYDYDPYTTEVRLTLTGPESDLDRLLQVVGSEDSEFDFDKVIPTPTALKEGVQDYEDFWRMDNWGSVLPASHVEIRRARPNRAEIRFVTAEEPKPIISHLREQFPTLRFEILVTELIMLRLEEWHIPKEVVARHRGLIPTEVLAIPERQET
jgi:hypothetical protein